MKHKLSEIQEYSLLDAIFTASILTVYRGGGEIISLI